jgi:hypothetical protein
MMLTNDTRSWQRNIFPLIKESHHPVESNSVRKALAFVEFSRISISDYGIVPPHVRSDLTTSQSAKPPIIQYPFLMVTGSKFVQGTKVFSASQINTTLPSGCHAGELRDHAAPEEGMYPSSTTVEGMRIK